MRIVKKMALVGALVATSIALRANTSLLSHNEYKEKTGMKLRDREEKLFRENPDAYMRMVEEDDRDRYALQEKWMARKNSIALWNERFESSLFV